MTTATITINPNGSGSITLDGSSTPISAAGVQAAQAVGMRQVKRHASGVGAPVHVEVHDPQGVKHLSVEVDGTITRIDPPQLAAVVSETPAWTQEQAGGTAVTPEQSQPMPTPSHADFAPAPVVQASPEFTMFEEADPSDSVHEVDLADDDPRWTSIAQQPAAQGMRGKFNGLGLTIAPNATELAERRAAYDRERGEAERRRIEQEDAARHEAAVTRERQDQQTRREARRREEEKTQREQRRTIQTNFQGCRTVLVANQKGGARKTTSTYLLAATLGIIRGGGVIAWDANETQGTLGDRAAQDMHSRTVVDLLEQAADDFSSPEGSRLGTLDRFVRNQGDAHFDVLASDEDAIRQDIVDGDGFRRVHEILTRFYRLVLVDTGNNRRAEHFLAAVDATDQLVIPVAASRDSAKPAKDMMKALAAAGHADLVSNAVVLIHDLEAIGNADEMYLETVREIAADFEGRVSAVVPIPFDAALKGGDEIDYATLAEPTRRAYREAAAALAASLRRSTLEG